MSQHSKKISLHRIQYRKAPISPGGTPESGYDAVLATGGVIEGPFGPERLVMSRDAIQMAADHTAPFHDDHGPHLRGGLGNRVGRVTDLRVVDDQLLGHIQLSRNEGGEQMGRDIADGIVREVSIGYRIQDAEFNDDGVLVITQWAVREVAAPSIVADPAAVIQRRENMSDDTLNVQSNGSGTDPQAEVDRLMAIELAFRAAPQAQELRSRAIDEGWDLPRTQSEIVARLSAGYVHVGRGGGDIHAGEDAMERFIAGAGEALAVRAMLTPDPKGEIRARNEFMGFSCVDLAREYLRIAGDRTRGDAKYIVGIALTRAGIISHSTSDFANILVDASNKALQQAYEEAPETFRIWTRAGTLPDFKLAHRPKLSTFSDLDEIGESGEFKYGTFSDKKETIILATYGKLFSITRQAIINDDLRAFTDAPRAMARAAARKVGDLVYAVITSNPNMSDGNALFSAAHSNLVASGSGAPPSVATLNAAYASMATQTDIAGNTLNIGARYILAPHVLRGTVDALLASALNPAEGTTTAFQETNIWRARLEPAYEARLDADSATKWYLAAAQGASETLEVAYLNGVQTPRLEREQGFTVDGVTLKVAHDAGVAPLEWVGLYQNFGA